MYFQIQIKSKTVRRNTKSPHELAIFQRKKIIGKKISTIVGKSPPDMAISQLYSTPAIGFYEILQLDRNQLRNRHLIWRFLNFLN